VYWSVVEMASSVGDLRQGNQSAGITDNLNQFDDSTSQPSSANSLSVLGWKS